MRQSSETDTESNGGGRLNQLSFDFYNPIITLKDKDGDDVIMSKYTDKAKAVAYFLHCSKTKAVEHLAKLEKQYDVYTCGFWQIVLAKGTECIYNFELNGESFYQGHKYNELGQWAFIHFIEGRKVEKKKSRKKDIIIMCTERQLQKAKALMYASKIGFNITYKDYQRWHLL